MDSEGFLRVGGLQIFYRSEGEPAKGTVLGLHGGPGGTYDYLSPLFDLARHGYRVVLYDQTGGGKSEVPKDKSSYTVERFVEEVEGVRKALGLRKFHLYGHSWGGMLAQAYALNYQRNLSSLIISGSTASIPEFDAEMEKIFLTLPADVRKKVTKYESAGDFENPELLAAYDVFNRRHQCRLDPWPEAVQWAFAHFSRPVGETMFGPYLVKVTGNMRYWDVTDRLGKLKLSTLIICGDLDFLTPRLHHIMHRKIRGSKLVVLKGISHASMWEARDDYIKALRVFLDRI